MKGCFIVSAICFVLQVVSWVGNASRAASLGLPAYSMPTSYGLGYMIGSNIMLIVAIVFLVIGLVLRSKKNQQ